MNNFSRNLPQQLDNCTNKSKITDKMLYKLRYYNIRPDFPEKRRPAIAGLLKAIALFWGQRFRAISLAFCAARISAA